MRDSSWNTMIFQKFVAKQLLNQFDIYYFWWKNKPVVEMQVSRLSISCAFGIISFACFSFPFVVTVVFSFLCQEYSHYLSYSLYPCCKFVAFYLFCFHFPSPMLKLPQLTTFFSICAYKNMQITLYVNMHAWTCIPAWIFVCTSFLSECLYI